MYSKKKLINRKNKRLSKKKRTKNGKKPLFRLYAKKKFVKYC
jgi:hypothetical protein